VRCRYDEPGGARRILSAERDQTILTLRGEGRPVSLIAQRFGISRRTVFRVLAATRMPA
jgi:DNA invertase Pin-like site-specific DNA recombinase